MINQIPLNMNYLWAYEALADECETAGPTLIFKNMPETQQERSQLFQEYGNDADYYLCERCYDPNYH